MTRWSPPDPAAGLALAIAGQVRDAVDPLLGVADARVRVATAVGGDATLAIDEVAERTAIRLAEAAGDVALYTEDHGWVEFGEPEALLVIDPVDGTRPAAAGLESCCVSIALAPPDADATLGDVALGVVTELKTGRRFLGRRGGGVDLELPGVGPEPVRRSENVELDRMFWTAGLRGRPALPTTVVLEHLIDAGSLDGGFFDLGSATFNMTRLLTGQLDAYVDVGRRMIDEVPEVEARFRAVAEGALCTNFPYDVAAAALVVTEGGGVVTHADGRSLDDHPLVGSSDREGIAVLAAANETLHERLLAEVDAGVARLRSWVSGA